MPLTSAKCTQCGASIEVDNTKDAGICTHCGTAFITEKAIKNYNTYVTKSITKNIYGKERTEAEEYIANAEVFIKLKDWDKAAKAFAQAAELNPGNYKGWLGLVRSETENFTNLDNISHIEHYTKALAVASGEETEIVKNLCEEYVNLSKKYREESHNLVAKHNERHTLNFVLFLVLVIVGSMTGTLGFALMVIFFNGLYIGIAGVIITAAGVVKNAIYNKNAKLINNIKLPELKKQILQELNKKK